MKTTKLLVLLFVALFCAFRTLAQNTVTLGASVTSGNGSITTEITWDTNPRLTTGTPCVASGHANWAGNKAGFGSQTITISTSGTLPLQLTCTFPGDSIVVTTWTPATQNTDGSAYTQAQRGVTRLRHTFNTTLSATAPCNTGGVTCVDLADNGATRPTMHTITGVATVGTFRVLATHISATGGESVGSNQATKAFTGAVPVTQSVSITVNPLPGPPTAVTTQ